MTALALTGVNDITATVGDTVSVTLPEATGGTTPYVYSLTPTPPSGLTFTPVTRVLEGSPDTATAQATYTYTCTDADSTVVNQTYSITIEAAGVAVNNPQVATVDQAIARERSDPFAGAVTTFDEARKAHKGVLARITAAKQAVKDAESELQTAEDELTESSGNALVAAEALESLLAKYKGTLSGQ